MFLTRIREKYESGTIVVGKYCAALRIRPDHLTAASFVLGLLGGVCLWFWYYKIAVVFLLLSGFADMADGATARYLKRDHPFGTVLDRVSDRYVEFFVATGCIGSGLVHPAWLVFSLFGGLMASYARASAESSGRVKNCAVGLVERQEKAFLFVVGIAVEPFLNPKSLKAAGLHPFPYPMDEGILILQLCVILVGILSHITVFQRLLYAKRHENEIQYTH